MCAPPGCVVQAARFAGFAPALAVVESGGAVTWRAMDGDFHTATEGPRSGTLPRGSSFCFYGGFTSGADATVTFALRDGRLYAEEGGLERECREAVVAPDGLSASLAYHCVPHVEMNGVLLVVRNPT